MNEQEHFEGNQSRTGASNAVASTRTAPADVLLLRQLIEANPNFSRLFRQLREMEETDRGIALEQLRLEARTDSEGSGLAALLIKLHETNQFQAVFDAVEKLNRKPIVLFGREFGVLEFVVLCGCVVITVASVILCWNSIRE